VGADYKTSDQRMMFERFDSTSDDHRDQKLVFKYIQRLEATDLMKHLVDTENRFDVTEIYDKNGYSPLHFAAYKNSFKTAEILCNFVSS
jgi:ankyrin repeat protein